jgi:hypothetical protein
MAISGDGQTQAELTEYFYIDKAATSRTLILVSQNATALRRDRSI